MCMFPSVRHNGVGARVLPDTQRFTATRNVSPVGDFEVSITIN